MIPLQNDSVSQIVIMYSAPCSCNITLERLVLPSSTPVYLGNVLCKSIPFDLKPLKIPLLIKRKSSNANNEWAVLKIPLTHMHTGMRLNGGCKWVWNPDIPFPTRPSHWTSGALVCGPWCWWYVSVFQCMIAWVFSAWLHGAGGVSLVERVCCEAAINMRWFLKSAHRFCVFHVVMCTFWKSSHSCVSECAMGVLQKRSYKCQQ